MSLKFCCVVFSLMTAKQSLMLFESHRLTVKQLLPSSVLIGISEVQFVPYVKSLGFMLDCNLNVTRHVLNAFRSAYIQLKQFGSVCHLLIPQATVLCFHFLLAGLLPQPTCLCPPVSYQHIAKGSECNYMTYPQSPQSKKAMTMSN